MRELGARGPMIWTCVAASTRPDPACRFNQAAARAAGQLGGLLQAGWRRAADAGLATRAPVPKAAGPA